MAKTLDKKFNRIRKIKKQYKEYATGNYENFGYYFSNMIKILFGKEPSHVSPNNRVVNCDLRCW
jgi:hypothetical protein